MFDERTVLDWLADDDPSLRWQVACDLLKAPELRVLRWWNDHVEG